MTFAIKLKRINPSDGKIIGLEIFPCKNVRKQA